MAIVRALLVASLLTPAAADEFAATEFFEREIRPLLVSKCGGCHGGEKAKSRFRVDSRAAILRGGERGPAIVPGDSAASRLVQAVARTGDPKMPPDRALGEREVRALARWIEAGAPWPASVEGTEKPAASEKHWAFEPVRAPTIPRVGGDAPTRNPIDAFVRARLEGEGLEASPEADRRTLIRRLSFALRGLPPSVEEVREFLRDPRLDAYERLVDSFLDSPRYGERWARHWLDVARYSDTKGYVYAREERTWIHAWTYRDWVVRALNEDLPYDRFLRLQIAADQIEDRRPEDLAAMGFLTLGRRFLGVAREIIDDRIDVVTRGTLGLTVSCARCHDHKYDPIATADYYSLYGVFDSSSERVERLPGGASDAAFESELAKRQEKLATQLAAFRLEASDRARRRIGDYLKAQTRLGEFPADGFDQIFQPDDLLPAFVRRWEEFLRRAREERDPIFVPWHAYASLPQESFAKLTAEVTRALQSGERGDVHPLIGEAFREPPKSFDDVIDRYARVLTAADERWKAARRSADASTSSVSRGSLDDATDALRRVLYGENAPCEVPDEAIVDCENFFDSGRVGELWKLQGEVDRWIINARGAAPFTTVLRDRSVPARPRIFRRGNPIDKGEEVPRRFLPVIAETSEPFRKGSGRLELAEAIASPSNPLTARVIVNRVWMHHFGRGFVATPSDFGRRAAPPSHPELLDWLAARFVTDGWSLKKLHRTIVLSATFRQASTGPSDPRAKAAAEASDPDNRLLWRMTPRRLTFEEFRDAMLAVASDLEPAMGGKPFDLFGEPFGRRRTLYAKVDRQFLPAALRTFDFANPDLHIPARRETTVPQQALFFLNHPLVLDRALALARYGESAKAREIGIRALFARAFQREPDAAELREGAELIESARPVDAAPATARDWQYGFGLFDEKAKRVANFAPLPHFTGEAWQGGARWPDPKLGWVQLTATGGHPGNDKEHASIRRWTAPRAMAVRIESRLAHEPKEGDGISARIVSSRSGLLARKEIHRNASSVSVGEVEVIAGETIDFVVDIGGTLSHDQYSWEIDIRDASLRAHEASVAWNSRTDFTPDSKRRLGGWAQLAQILLSTNEFLFID